MLRCEIFLQHNRDIISRKFIRREFFFDAILTINCCVYNELLNVTHFVEI